MAESEKEAGGGGRGGSREEMSRSIKLPQTMDVALRNIKDAKVRKCRVQSDIKTIYCTADFVHLHSIQLQKDADCPF